MMEQEFHQKAYVMDMEGPPHIILGMPWLKEANPKIDWHTQKITFRNEEELLQG